MLATANPASQGTQQQESGVEQSTWTLNAGVPAPTMPNGQLQPAAPTPKLLSKNPAETPRRAGQSGTRRKQLSLLYFQP